MNLISDPWLPVVFRDGSFRKVGLNEVFEKGHDIIDLILSPPERISVMRLLLCITHAAIDGPADDDEWRSCKSKILASVIAYLAGHQNQFELFGEGAFLQLSGLQEKSNALLDKLDPTLDIGDNRAVVYDHQSTSAGRNFPPDWCALKLITYQNISVGGKIGSGNWNGKPFSTGTSEQAPALENCFLHTFLRGENLLDTIHYNLVTKEDIRKSPPLQWGHPVWEKMPTGVDDPEIKASTRSYLGRLVPVSRGIRLKQGESTISLTNGFTYPKFDGRGFRDPFATVVTRNMGKKVVKQYLRVSLDKHPWRDLGAILSINEGSAFVFRKLLKIDPHSMVDVWTGGLSANKSSIHDAVEWSFRFEAGLVEDIYLSILRIGIDLAQAGEAALRSALASYYQNLKYEGFSTRKAHPNKDALLEKGIHHYWNRLDGVHQTLLDMAQSQQSDPTAGQSSIDQDWRPLVQKAMRDTYGSVCPHGTARQLQAFVQGNMKLNLKRGTENPKNG